MKTDEIQITPIGVEVVEAQERAGYDIQIATAKKYPRDLQRVKENTLAIVTMDKKVAESCRYALPRGGKPINGPSVHLARIIAQQYGNVRVDSRVTQITATQVVSEAVCFDLETNYAVKVEVRRSIVGNRGRYNEDMITVTGNAANAIAFRNAVFNVIPKGLADIAYQGALNAVTGDLSDEDKLRAARVKALGYFKSEYGVEETEVLNALGLRAATQIKAEQIADLKGIIQAIKDGDTTVEETFPKPKADASEKIAEDIIKETMKEATSKKGTDGKES